MVTRDEVAKHAGVSVAVVSYVINNKPVVKEATRQKVLQAIRELGYSPNLTARSLKTRRTNQIGVLFNHIGNPFETGIALGLEHRARKDGQSLIFQTYDPLEEDHLKTLFSGRVDAIILLGQSLKTDTVDHFAKIGVPLFSVMTPDQPNDIVPCADINWYEAYRAMIEHLIRFGHTRIGFMGALNRESYLNVRFRHFRRALLAQGLEFRDEWLVHGSFGSLEMAYKQMSERLSGGTDLPFTAIVCANDLMAIGVLSACRDNGVSVPGQLSIASSENILMSSHTSPPLTTVHYPRPEIGVATIEEVMNHLNTGAPLSSRTLKHEIYERSSTGQAPG
ncbi:LacI family DNA-binding transcriptional regulator [Paenibacillus oceani]|uniref:LacI family DNA-binding transcriptional regulator n=1 Tax=Paenibacillus oceani TaxID=2772510 RepID=A0A927CBI4_9BACL|nr:LacI family DNA-binding transcriptional regulator [Paenibacillus oceani]MBD2864399.1 LacI family DNA-binding transcriptional regulator [Paenibacillus oceani]